MQHLPDSSIPDSTNSKSTMDEDFWRQVERSRSMTPDERVREGLALIDRTYHIMLDGIRHQFPNADPQTVTDIFDKRRSLAKMVDRLL